MQVQEHAGDVRPCGEFARIQTGGDRCSTGFEQFCRSSRLFLVIGELLCEQGRECFELGRAWFALERLLNQDGTPHVFHAQLEPGMGLLCNNVLHDRGYRSIGCYPCTLPTSGGDERGGRWPGFDKKECGLHTRTKKGLGG